MSSRTTSSATAAIQPPSAVPAISRSRATSCPPPGGEVRRAAPPPPGVAALRAEPAQLQTRVIAVERFLERSDNHARQARFDLPGQAAGGHWCR